MTETIRDVVRRLFLFCEYIAMFDIKTVYSGCMRLIFNVLAVIGWVVFIMFSLWPDWVIGLVV